MIHPSPPDLGGIIEVLDAASVALTLGEVASNVELIGPVSDGTSAVLVLSGTMHVRVGDEHVSATKGHVVLTPGNNAARISGRKSPCRERRDSKVCLERRGRWLVANASPDRPATLSIVMVRIAGGRHLPLAGPVALSLIGTERGRQLFSLLGDHIGKHEPGSPAIALAIMGACIVEACQSIGDPSVREPASQTPASVSLSRAMTAVHDRPGDPHDVDTLAALAGMSRSTFVRQLSALTMLSPMQYVLQTRLEAAASLLRTTDLAIKAVANLTGFQSRSHFSRAFRSRMGCDPSTYRAQATA